MLSLRPRKAPLALPRRCASVRDLTRHLGSPRDETDSIVHHRARGRDPRLPSRSSPPTHRARLQARSRRRRGGRASAGSEPPRWANPGASPSAFDGSAKGERRGRSTRIDRSLEGGCWRSQSSIVQQSRRENLLDPVRSPRSRTSHRVRAQRTEYQDRQKPRERSWAVRPTDMSRGERIC